MTHSVDAAWPSPAFAPPPVDATRPSRASPPPPVAADRKSGGPTILSDLPTGDRHLLATPAGAYFAVSANDDDPLRDALFSALARPYAWPPAAEAARAAPGESSESGAAPSQETLDRLFELEWIDAAAQDAEPASAEPLERLLPELLAALSGEGCALLADHQGLQIAVAGFGERQAQGLAALSSEAISLGLRHRQLMRHSGTRTPAAWAMVDAAGNSQIGVWPLFLGRRWFALVVGGRPLFARQAFLRLVRTLVRRTAAESTICTMINPVGLRPGSNG